jgi:hypothetical protein
MVEAAKQWVHTWCMLCGGVLPSVGLYHPKDDREDGVAVCSCTGATSRELRDPNGVDSRAVGVFSELIIDRDNARKCWACNGRGFRHTYGAQCRLKGLKK